MIDASLGLLGLLAHPSPPPSPPSDLDSGFLRCDTTAAGVPAGVSIVRSLQQQAVGHHTVCMLFEEE